MLAKNVCNPTAVFCMLKNLSESVCAQVGCRPFFRLYSGDMKWISLSKTCLMPSKMKYGRVRHRVLFVFMFLGYTKTVSVCVAGELYIALDYTACVNDIHVICKYTSILLHTQMQ